jgi:hypothetical protein
MEVDKVVLKEYASYDAALNDLKDQGVKHLGWLNSGIKVPDGNYTRVYQNRTGSSSLFCDKVQRIAYSVDMGD